MANDSAFASRIFGLVFVGLLAYALVLILKPFLGPALWAFLIAFLLFPLNRWLRARMRGRKGLAALTLTAAVILGIVIPASIVSIAFVRQGSDLLARLSSMADQYKIARPSDLLHVPLVDRALHFLQDKFPASAEQVQQWLVQGLSDAVQFLLARGRSAFVGALGAMVSLGLMLFLMYFFFRDGDDFAIRSIRLIPANEGRKTRLVKHVASVTRAVVIGSLATALAQGAGIGIGFWICGLPSPVVFGVLAAVLALLPVGGTAFVWVPGALLLGAQNRWGFAIFLAIWGALIVGSADNVLRPMLISGRAQISTLPVFFGVIGGLAAFGMIGMFLGPVLVALAQELFRFAEEDRIPAGGGVSAAG
jgi:predicted PurR-regulated permease PerM